MHPGRPSASGSGGMSTEQLQRMEANVQKKSSSQLTAKRVAPPHTGVQGPLPAKRLSYTTSAATQRWRLQSLV